MDELLPKLLSFPPHPPPQTPLSDHAYDEGIKALYNTLKNLSETKLLTQTSGGESVLDVRRFIFLNKRQPTDLY